LVRRTGTLWIHDLAFRAARWWRGSSGTGAGL